MLRSGAVRHLCSQSWSLGQESEPNEPVQRQSSVRKDIYPCSGPFPRSDQGNWYLLIATDYFITKCPIAYAVPNQESSKLAEDLITNFICSFRIPREPHSDEGSNFESRLMQVVLQRLWVSKRRAKPLHPQSDSMVERYIKTTEQNATSKRLKKTYEKSSYPTREIKKQDYPSSLWFYFI
jgi:hypothetical protein